MAEQEFQDLIIIKRRLATEAEAVKGGVWKIAFADFMTAMMCFFLVMWLINAANEDTRQAVASYFNPVRLAELNRKGIADPHLSENTTPDNSEATSEPAAPAEHSSVAPPAEHGEAAAASHEAGAPPAGPDGAIAQDATASEAARDALFRDPYRVLSEIADEAGEARADAAAASGPGSAGTGSGVAAYRDPFDPEVSAAVAPPQAASGESPTDAAKASEPQENAQAGTAAPADAAAVAAAAEESAAAPPVGAALYSPPAPMAMSAPAGPSGDGFPMSSPAGVEPHAAVAIPQAPDATIETEIARAVEAGSGGSGNPNVTVENTREGVMISLTDDVDFGMFEIGSAEPQPETVRVMERIAEILKSRPGTITVRGHTDARPFRGGSYDNWRLSTDRAQIAYYMLVRGGLDEGRVVSIEGFADRRPKLPEDPEAAGNRRIEILLHEDAQ